MTRSLAVECLAVVEGAIAPHRLWRALAAETPIHRPFLLESALRRRDDARWSFFGANPFRTLTAFGRRLLVYDRAGDRFQRHIFEDDPLAALTRMLEAHQAIPDGETIVPFRGGAVGAIAYDLGRLIEPVAMRRTGEPSDPDLDLGFYDGVVAFDHATDRAAFFWTRIEERPPRWLTDAIRLATREETPPSVPSVRGSVEAFGTMSRIAYAKAVRSVKEFIAAGDIYQANLTYRFEVPWQDGPATLYERLRKRNPAPFAAHLDMGGYAILSSSPERFLRFDAATRRIETRPIKGTRPRGDSAEAERDHTTELLGSSKEAAELVMIVDLERNDLGRVCEFGSVHVPELRAVERYARVQHTVATVEGVVRSGCSIGEILRATFPGGSITGAPKIRAMQIIDALEPDRRGFYTGSIGYFDFGGNFDLNIAIRTVVLRDGHATFGVGSGIVADSDPDAEYDETLVKASALFDALGVARCTPISG